MYNKYNTKKNSDYLSSPSCEPKKTATASIFQILPWDGFFPLSPLNIWCGGYIGLKRFSGHSVSGCENEIPRLLLLHQFFKL